MNQEQKESALRRMAAEEVMYGKEGARRIRVFGSIQDYVTQGQVDALRQAEDTTEAKKQGLAAETN